MSESEESALSISLKRIIVFLSNTGYYIINLKYWSQIWNAFRALISETQRILELQSNYMYIAVK